MPHADPIDSSQPSTMPKPGEIVAEKYRIEKLLAEGGMGFVYAATHLQLEEKVAIKFLRAEFMGPQAGELPGRFLREARMSAKIKSEHVVRVHDVGSAENGGPYIVMEFLTGEDLDQVVTHRGVLAIDQAVDYVLQACEALAEAHDIGIVHRDLKPANLFLTHRADGSPSVKVLDFGISKFQDGAGNTRDFGMTKTHAIMGSPNYMSPEQMRSSKDVDARADIWAIGIILYELLAGTVPFDGESMPQICAAILEDTPKSICAMRPEISPELEAIIMKCLAKEPADRYENVAVLAQALSPWGTNEAWASADRIARVLGVAGEEAAVDTTPNPVVKPASLPPSVSPVSSAPPPPAAAPLPFPLVVPAPHPAASSNASDVEAAWAGLEMKNPRIKQRRRLIFAAIAASLVMAGIGARAAIFVEHRRNPVETTAAIVHTGARSPVSQTPQPVLTIDVPTPPPTAANVETPVAKSASPEPTPARTADAPTSKPAGKHATSHAPAPRPVSPPAAQTSQAVSPEDLWGERK